MRDDAAWGAAVRAAFGRRLREVRLAAEISQEEMAHRSGLDRSYVGQVERGERNLTLENIYRLAEGLGVPTASLVVELNDALDLTPTSREEAR